MTRTIAVTGSASGMGAATRAVLEADGQRVIGVDLRDAEVVADLGTSGGRADAIAAVAEQCGGVLDGLVTWAGIPGLTTVEGGGLVSVNYFGTVVVAEGLRGCLARGDAPAAVVVSSNSTLIQPGVPMDVVDLCLAGDEATARAAADAASALATYPATKTALARWARRNAPDWASDGITLNAIAPGAVETPLLQATRDDPVIGAFIDGFPIPVGRPGTPDEIAHVVAFLLGPHGRFFCGSFVVVDGGTDALLRADDTPIPWQV